VLMGFQLIFDFLVFCILCVTTTKIDCKQMIVAVTKSADLCYRLLVNRAILAFLVATAADVCF